MGKRILCWFASVALVLLSQVALAALTVTNGDLKKSDEDHYPGGIGARDVRLPGGFDFNNPGVGEWFPSGNLSWYYNGTEHSLQIGNEARALNAKHVWFQLKYVTGHASAPQKNGDVFDPDLWPHLTASGTVTPTGASWGGFIGTEYDAYGNIIGGTNTISMTWDIFPQPSSETIFLPFPALKTIHWTNIRSLEVATICTVVPEPEIVSMMAIGLALMGVHRATRVRSATGARTI